MTKKRKKVTKAEIEDRIARGQYIPWNGELLTYELNETFSNYEPPPAPVVEKKRRRKA